tara:strand:- start:81 stop:455 length:375 start_codon:yes stop_codon:yes gene_type:complete
MYNNNCYICLESVKRPADLNLYCDCKYNVHYTCYLKWWKNNNSCIICQVTSPYPEKYKRKNRKKKKHKKTYAIPIAGPTVLTVDIRNYPIRNFPYDNNYEIRTLKVVVIFSFFLSIIYTLFQLS